jgi:hypothetical protein
VAVVAVALLAVHLLAEAALPIGPCFPSQREVLTRLLSAVAALAEHTEQTTLETTEQTAALAHS